MNKERVLVVEDEAIIRESLKQVLQQAGYNVEAVGSAEDQAWSGSAT